MKIFLTGASGWVGSHLTPLLLEAGHQLSAIARSDASAKKLEDLGIKVLPGSLEDHDVLRKGASEADAVVHLAFIHDFSNMAKSAEVDLAAIHALAGALEGTNKILIGTSGVGTPGVPNPTELDKGTVGPRGAGENILFEYASKGVRAFVVRLPFTVHGDGDHGFIPAIIRGAKGEGAVSYVGDGSNRWPTIHVKDAAKLYQLALESTSLKAGTVLCAVQNECVPFKAIAEAIAKGLHLPLKSIDHKEAIEKYAFIGMCMGYDVNGSSALTREWTGWEPKEKSLLEDLETSATYFA